MCSNEKKKPNSTYDYIIKKCSAELTRLECIAENNPDDPVDAQATEMIARIKIEAAKAASEIDLNNRRDIVFWPQETT